MEEKFKGPAPKMPKVERITDVEQLMPMARKMVSRKTAPMYEGWQFEKGQKILFINDTSADQLVFEALSRAAREKGAHVTTITLEGFPGLKDSVDLVDQMFARDWYPGWVWDAANQADEVLLMAFLKGPYIKRARLANGRLARNPEITADLMVSEHQSYPVEIRDLIDEVTWEKLDGSPEIIWKDLEGTDITINLTPEEWRRAAEYNIKKAGNPYRLHGHVMVPAPSKGISGVLVSSSITFGGPIARTKLQIEGGGVVSVEGGGKFGERLKESFTRYAHLSSTVSITLKAPGPGVNWLTTIGICTNPKAIRSPFFEEFSGSARIYAWMFGHRRSGVIHSSIGEGLAPGDYRIIRHVDTYFNTMTTEKGVVIENGHLTALDDPRVKEVAAKYGDPEELLREIWIPAVSGVNAP